MQKVEKWLKDAKEAAKEQAELVVTDIKALADEHQVEKWWFFEEVLKHISRIRAEEEKKG